jgi:hypothetical protein
MKKSIKFTYLILTLGFLATRSMADDALDLNTNTTDAFSRYNPYYRYDYDGICSYAGDPDCYDQDYGTNVNIYYRTPYRTPGYRNYYGYHQYGRYDRRYDRRADHRGRVSHHDADNRRSDGGGHRRGGNRGGGRR